LSILVVEDHPTIARQVVDFLDGLKWHTDHAATGALAISLALREPYDVILLDLNLPDIDGLEVCRAIKAGAPRSVPVLMLTARDAFEDEARGFHGGADDYLTKPFDLRELALRCAALARRGQLHVSQELRVGSLLLLPREKRALYDGAPLALTVVERLLQREAASMTAQFIKHGESGQPASDWIRAYASADALPPDVREQVRAGRLRAEVFGGAGQHYHLRTLDLQGRSGSACWPRSRRCWWCRSSSRMSAGC